MDPEMNSVAEDLLQAIRTWVSAAPEPGPTSDWVVIQSGLSRASDLDLRAVLSEFFDVEPVVLEVRDIVARRAVLSQELRSQMAEALIFHGFDDEAATFIG
jgi:hypothetical protein